MIEEMLKNQFESMEIRMKLLEQENERLKKENQALKKYFILLWGYVE